MEDSRLQLGRDLVAHLTQYIRRLKIERLSTQEAYPTQVILMCNSRLAEAITYCGKPWLVSNWSQYLMNVTDLYAQGELLTYTVQVQVTYQSSKWPCSQFCLNDICFGS